MSERTEINASIGKMVLLVAGTFGFVVIGVVLILHTDFFGAVIGLLTVLFFGACMVIALWRLFTLHGTVITMTREGIRDIRIAPEFVRWNEIEDISTWRSSGQKVLVLKVGDDTWERLTLSAIAKKSRSANRALGADGLAISSTELKTTHDALLDAINAHIKRA